jgi:hypothetical protein
LQARGAMASGWRSGRSGGKTPALTAQKIVSMEPSVVCIDNKILILGTVE